MFRCKDIRRQAASAALVIFVLASVGGIWHHHDNDPGPVCHICQMLHMPALAFSAPVHVQTPAVLGNLVELPETGTPRDFAFAHRPSRAPPLA